MADYERLERLGSGNFGEVWLVYDHALGVHRAVKYINPNRITNPTNFYEEPQTLMALRHSNIIKVVDAGRTLDGTLYVAMEYLPKGSVENAFKGGPVIPLRKALEILKDVSWAVEYAHKNNYIHCDIKPANILLTTDGKAKLSDFGLAKHVPKGETVSICGYLSHIAPEVFRTCRTSKTSDIYALGVTAYRLINGDSFLPEITDPDDIQDLILAGKYPDRDKYRPYVPNALKKIINQCMALEENKRFKCAADFRRALEKLILYCDWFLKRKRNITSYRTKINKAKIVVDIKRNKDRFDIETIREVTKGQPRRVIKDCFANLSKVQMKKNIRTILSRYVSKGK